MIEYFVAFRLRYYVLRKKRSIEKIERELKIASNRMRFIEEILLGNLLINNRPKKEIITDLTDMGFGKEDGNYNYLLNMPIYSLTKEKAVELKKTEASKEAELEQIKKTTPEKMYESDLHKLLRQIKNEAN